MSEPCLICGREVFRSDLPSGRTVTCDAEPVQAVVIDGPDSEREARVKLCWPIHEHTAEGAVARKAGEGI